MNVIMFSEVRAAFHIIANALLTNKNYKEFFGNSPVPDSLTDFMSVLGIYDTGTMFPAGCKITHTPMAEFMPLASNRHSPKTKVRSAEGAVLCKITTDFGGDKYFVSFSAYDRDSTNSESCSYILCNRKDYYSIISTIRRAIRKASPEVAPIIKIPIMSNRIASTVREIINFHDNVNEYVKYGGRITKGYVFTGVPGNGKSMTCNYIMETLDNRNRSCGLFTNTDIDDGIRTNRLSKMLNSYDLVIFDDVDVSFLTNRKSSLSDHKSACALLSAMNGVQRTKSSIRIFTTNEKHVDFDPAFMRPGRIDEVVHFTTPDQSMRQALINSWHHDITSSIDIPSLVSRSEGMSFAELDEIKARLIQNFVLSSSWNLDKAFDDYNNRLEDKAFVDKNVPVSQNRSDEELDDYEGI